MYTCVSVYVCVCVRERVCVYVCVYVVVFVCVRACERECVNVWNIRRLKGLNLNKLQSNNQLQTKKKFHDFRIQQNLQLLLNTFQLEAKSNANVFDR